LPESVQFSTKHEQVVGNTSEHHRLAVLGCLASDAVRGHSTNFYGDARVDLKKKGNVDSADIAGQRIAIRR
jgi:hypothetical protein